MKNLFFFALLATGSSFGTVHGIFPRISKISENHALKSYSVEEIEGFIITSSNDGHACNDHYHGDFSKVDNRASKAILSANELARQIKETSDVFEIDAGLYASLIYKESQFCNFGGTIFQTGKVPTQKARASSTDAIGLTMFTSIAVKGIHDQLFSTSTKVFHFKVRPDLHRKMYTLGFADINPKSEEDANYYKNGVYKNDQLYQANPKTKTAFRNPLKWRSQILYGAIYLKMLLSKSSRPKVFVTTNNISHYRYVLEEYNGADLKQRTDYWNYIFSIYNDIFGDNFKDSAKKQGISFSSSKWTKDKEKMGL